MVVVSKIIGLGIGEETKGAWVEFLVQQTQAKHVWRKGGPQSGHHIVIDDQTQVMLSHFGSGVFQGIPTFVDMPIIPTELFVEAQKLESLGVANPLSLISINASCLVVTPYHQALSRLREIMRTKKKGTIGLGVGEAIKKAKLGPHLRITAHDLKLAKVDIEKKIEVLRRHLLDEALKLVFAHNSLPDSARIEINHLQNECLIPEIADSYILLSNLVSIEYEDQLDNIIAENIVVESSHGALLHPKYGYLPHVTQIDPTAQDANLKLKQHHFKGSIKQFGVIRSYSTRFGAGPLVTECETFPKHHKEAHNKDNDWLGRFRTGPLDLVGIKYGTKICGEPKLDGVMISYLDYLKDETSWPVCTSYIYTGTEPNISDFFEVVDGEIKEIRLHDTAQADNTDHQVELTKLLSFCKPVITTIYPNEHLSLDESFISFVEEYLGIPVVATSHGPKISDRSLRSQHKNLLSSVKS